MDDEQRQDAVDTDEQTADQEALTAAEVKDEELREKLAEELGIDPEENEELFNKVFEREKANRKRLSSAISQKIKYRNSSKQPPKNDGKKPDATDPAELVRQEFERRDLESLDLPDELRQEVKELAEFKKISVREAAKSSYIQQRKSEIEKEERVRKASPSRSNKGGGKAPSYDPTVAPRPEDFDFSTPEGRIAWNEAKAAHRRHKSQ